MTNTTNTPTRDIDVPAWVAVPLALLIIAGMLLGGILIGRATAPERTVTRTHTVIVDQTYTGHQIAACIAAGICPAS